jgi:DNA-binding transcriptional regulator YdaS (Cro superfamily)
MPPPQTRDRDPGVELAIARAGSGAALGRALGITLGAVSLWKQVPIKHVPMICRLYRLREHELRPDVWPPPSQRRGRPRNGIRSSAG